MTTYRDGLPQLDGGLFLNDAGLETDLIFNKGVEIREFAAHTLLTDPVGRAALADYLRGFLTQIARVLKVDRARLAEGYLQFVEKNGSTPA